MIQISCRGFKLSAQAERQCDHNILNTPQNRSFTLFIYLFQVLHCFKDCTGHITMGSFVGRGKQNIQLVRVLYCKLPSIGKLQPIFPHKVQGLNLSGEASVLPLPSFTTMSNSIFDSYISGFWCYIMCQVSN